MVPFHVEPNLRLVSFGLKTVSISQCNLPGSCVLTDGTYRYWTGKCYLSSQFHLKLLSGNEAQKYIRKCCTCLRRLAASQRPLSKGGKAVIDKSLWSSSKTLCIFYEGHATLPLNEMANRKWIWTWILTVPWICWWLKIFTLLHCLSLSSEPFADKMMLAYYRIKVVYSKSKAERNGTDPYRTSTS
jgi:hypothetical protein